MSDNHTAIVTGGGQGIGKAVVLDLAVSGVDVAVIDVDLESAQAAAAEADRFEVRTVAVQADVADAASVESMVEMVSDRFGHIDYLINNAGVTRDGLLMRMDDSDWDCVLNVNLKGTYLCSKAVIRHMMKQKFGRVINMSSVVGAMGNAGQTNYAASKAGIIGFTKSLAREVASRGITVNAIAPGFIKTAMTDVLPEKTREELTARIPGGRLGVPEDIAAAVRFLVSDEASYITGSVLHINGGMYM